MRTWAEFVTDLMAAGGMTLQDVAERCGVTKYAVSKWKLGKSVPREHHKEALRMLAGKHNERIERLVNG